MYEGAPDYPAQGHLVGDRRALRRDDLLHRADRDPRVHEVGRRARRRRHDLSQAAPARHGRRADQPEGLALVLQGGRRRALPDRRHLVADRDRRDHDHARCPGSLATKPGSAGAAAARASRPTVVDEREGKPLDEGQGLLVLKRPWPAMLRTLYKEDDRFIETYFAKFGKDDLPRRRRRPQATRTATSGSSGASTTSSTSPATGCRPPRSSRRSSRTRRSPRRP